MHGNKVYGHLEWREHKSSWRHCCHMRSMFTSGVPKGIVPPVMLSTLSAIFVSVINFGVINPAWVHLLQISINPFILIAPVLAFLLVFRTNSSYQRFDEARKAWGSNVNRCRDLARQTLTWIRSPADQPKLNTILRYIKAYPFFLKLHLTQQPSNLVQEFPELATILANEEMNAIFKAHNRPIYILQLISALIHQCERPNNFERIAMDSNLTQFHDNVGACERIFKTPIPLAYTTLTSRMLILYHLALPYGLWASCTWFTIPATFMSSAALFYIEQVGVLIEEPFSVLPLDSICEGIVSAVDETKLAHNAALNDDAFVRLSLTNTHDQPVRRPSLKQIGETETIPLISASDEASLKGRDHSSKSNHHGIYKDHANDFKFSRLKSMP